MRDEPAICLSDLSRSFGSHRAVDGLDFEVPRGTLFALLGPNGAGKSTTISILTTLLAPTSGKASVSGWDVAKHPREVRRAIGVVFQELALDDRLTAKENLDFFAAIYGIERRARPERIEKGLASVGLASAADQRVRTLSGGMKRRLELARALLHLPAVLVLDEPTVGLDPQTRRIVWEHLASIARENDRTVFVTTHYMDEADRCDDVVVIDHGRLLAHGSPAALIARTGRDRLRVRCEDNDKATEVARSVGLLVQAQDGRLVIEGEKGEVMLARMAALGAGIQEASILRPSLEDAFVALTGQELRDVHDEDAGRHAAMSTNLRARGRLS